MISLRKPRYPGDWAALFRLYRESFPPSERKPFSIIVNMYRRGQGDVWCICRDGRFAGMATTINGPALTLLDYFAVKKHTRGQGVGTEALQQLLARYGDRGFFLEIESTREDAGDLASRLKRKAFYEHCGLVPLDVEAEVFGVRMELLGVNCRLDYEGYRCFYRDCYSPWAAEHIREVA